MLLLDATARPGRVGLAEGERLLATATLDDARRHARDLAGQTRLLFGEHGWSAVDLAAIVVATGPGSFAGIRVALSMAKAMAYVAKCPMIGIDAFDVWARRVRDDGRAFQVIVPFQLKTVLTVRFAPGGREPIVQRTVGELDEIAGEPWVGPALPDHPMAERLEVSPPDLVDLHALALDRIRRAQFDDPFAIEPCYARPSSAEALWDQRMARVGTVVDDGT